MGRLIAVLYELYIENLAVIKSAHIPFSNHFNVFTGETGAGKSILINGINSILGQRMTKDIVRTGEKKATITALFTNLSDTVCNRLDELNIAHDERMITITREVLADGGSVARINSRAVAISVLKEIGQMLVNVHGQHDNQILLNPEKHLSIIDTFGGDYSLLEDYQRSFKELQNLARRIGELKKLERSKAERLELLKLKIDELSSLNLTPDEDTSIEEEYNVCVNADTLIQSLDSAYSVLNTCDGSAMENVGLAKGYILKHEQTIPELKPLIERLESVYIELKDVSEELLILSNSIDLDEDRLEYLTNRRLELNHVKKKYSMPLNDIVNMYNNSLEEISKLENSSNELESLMAQKEALLSEVTKKAKALSEYRTKIAEDFTKRVTKELLFLNMPNVVFTVSHQEGKLTIHGMDSMEFLISANVGEPPKPISKIASGGELSRIMLALKTVISDKDNVSTLIFDEIDTGVSGKTAQKIGVKLKEVSKYRQVICVTHLTQIAVMGDHHLLIEKSFDESSTSTQVLELDHIGRVKEIARIMNGESPSELALKNAEELLLQYSV